MKKIIARVAIKRSGETPDGRQVRGRVQSSQQQLETCITALVAAMMCCKSEAFELVKFQGQTQCQRVDETASSFSEPTAFYDFQAIGAAALILALVVAVIVLIFRVQSLASGRTTPRQVEEKTATTKRGRKANATYSRTVATQSQTTYEWHRATPRFRAFGRDDDHGAWAEAPRLRDKG